MLGTRWYTLAIIVMNCRSQKEFSREWVREEPLIMQNWVGGIPLRSLLQLLLEEVWSGLLLLLVVVVVVVAVFVKGPGWTLEIGNYRGRWCCLGGWKVRSNHVFYIIISEVCRRCTRMYILHQFFNN